MTIKKQEPLYFVALALLALSLGFTIGGLISGQTSVSDGEYELVVGYFQTKVFLSNRKHYTFFQGCQDDAYGADVKVPCAVETRRLFRAIVPSTVSISNANLTKAVNYDSIRAQVYKKQSTKQRLSFDLNKLDSSTRDATEKCMESAHVQTSVEDNRIECWLASLTDEQLKSVFPPPGLIPKENWPANFSLGGTLGDPSPFSSAGTMEEIAFVTPSVTLGAGIVAILAGSLNLIAFVMPRGFSIMQMILLTVATVLTFLTHHNHKLDGRLPLAEFDGATLLPGPFYFAAASFCSLICVILHLPCFDPSHWSSLLTRKGVVAIIILAATAVAPCLTALFVPHSKYEFTVPAVSGATSNDSTDGSYRFDVLVGYNTFYPCKSSEGYSQAVATFADHDAVVYQFENGSSPAPPHVKFISPSPLGSYLNLKARNVPEELLQSPNSQCALASVDANTELNPALSVTCVAFKEYSKTVFGVVGASIGVAFIGVLFSVLSATISSDCRILAVIPFATSCCLILFVAVPSSFYLHFGDVCPVSTASLDEHYRNNSRTVTVTTSEGDVKNQTSIVVTRGSPSDSLLIANETLAHPSDGVAVPTPTEQSGRLKDLPNAKLLAAPFLLLFGGVMFFITTIVVASPKALFGLLPKSLSPTKNNLKLLIVSLILAVAFGFHVAGLIIGHARISDGRGRHIPHDLLLSLGTMYPCPCVKKDPLGGCILEHTKKPYNGSALAEKPVLYGTTSSSQVQPTEMYNFYSHRVSDYFISYQQDKLSRCSYGEVESTIGLGGFCAEFDQLNLSALCFLAASVAGIGLGMLLFPIRRFGNGRTIFVGETIVTILCGIVGTALVFMLRDVQCSMWKAKLKDMEGYQMQSGPALHVVGVVFTLAALLVELLVSDSRFAKVTPTAKAVASPTKAWIAALLLLLSVALAIVGNISSLATASVNIDVVVNSEAMEGIPSSVTVPYGQVDYHMISLKTCVDQNVVGTAARVDPLHGQLPTEPECSKTDTIPYTSAIRNNNADDTFMQSWMPHSPRCPALATSVSAVLTISILGCLAVGFALVVALFRHTNYGKHWLGVVTIVVVGFFALTAGLAENVYSNVDCQVPYMKNEHLTLAELDGHHPPDDQNIVFITKRGPARDFFVGAACAALASLLWQCFGSNAISITKAMKAAKKWLSKEALHSMVIRSNIFLLLLLFAGCTIMATELHYMRGNTCCVPESCVKDGNRAVRRYLEELSEAEQEPVGRTAKWNMCQLTTAQRTSLGCDPYFPRNPQHCRLSGSSDGRLCGKLPPLFDIAAAACSMGYTLTMGPILIFIAMFWYASSKGRTYPPDALLAIFGVGAIILAIITIALSATTINYLQDTTNHVEMGVSGDQGRVRGRMSVQRAVEEEESSDYKDNPMRCVPQINDDAINVFEGLTSFPPTEEQLSQFSVVQDERYYGSRKTAVLQRFRDGGWRLMMGSIMTLCGGILTIVFLVLLLFVG